MRVGERLYGAMSDGEICGVCGLNVDPFANDPTVGRVRRLYVARRHRRRGVASAILERLVCDAKAHFRVLHLRTYEAGAIAFYESIGFLAVRGDPNCTHRKCL